MISYITLLAIAVTFHRVKRESNRLLPTYLRFYSNYVKVWVREYLTHANTVILLSIQKFQEFEVTIQRDSKSLNKVQWHPLLVFHMPHE